MNKLFYFKLIIAVVVVSYITTLISNGYQNAKADNPHPFFTEFRIHYSYTTQVINGMTYRFYTSDQTNQPITIVNVSLDSLMFSRFKEK